MGLLDVVKSSVALTPESPSRTDSLLPDDIPEGCLPVFVGKERRRFVIRTEYLSHHLFKTMLKKCEEEFGFKNQGALTIMCEPSLFEHVLRLIQTDNPAAKTSQMQELVVNSCDSGDNAVPAV